MRQSCCVYDYVTLCATHEKLTTADNNFMSACRRLPSLSLFLTVNPVKIGNKLAPRESPEELSPPAGGPGISPNIFRILYVELYNLRSFKDNYETRPLELYEK